jgi:stringent starvation protein B
MISSRIYLIRAIYDWLFDCDMSVYMAVDANHTEAEVPREHVQNGQIVLDVSPEAVRDLELNSDYITFKARFSGKLQNILVPVIAVMAIYSAENGRGMVFGPEDPLSGELTPDSAPDELPSAKRSAKSEPADKRAKAKVAHLKVVKSDDDSKAD